MKLKEDNNTDITNNTDINSNLSADYDMYANSPFAGTQRGDGKVDDVNNIQEPYVYNVNDSPFNKEDNDKLKKKAKSLFGKMMVFILIGFLLFFWGSGSMLNRKRLVDKGGVVQGTITSSNYHSGSRRRSGYYSIYVTYTVNGQEYKNVYYGRSRSYSSKGEVRTVYYNKRDPYEICNGTIITFNDLMLVIFGVALLSVSGYIGVLCEKNPRKALDMDREFRERFFKSFVSSRRSRR